MITTRLALSLSMMKSLATCPCWSSRPHMRNMSLMPRSVTSGLVEPGVMAMIPASLYTSEAGMVEDEQKCPTTALTLS
ncbi:hypothetical protein D3C78_1768870 [compost metagenome]